MDKRTLLHDLRNEVTALESQVFLLERKLDPANEDAVKYVQRMKNSIERLRVHLAHLHDIAKAAD